MLEKNSSTFVLFKPLGGNLLYLLISSSNDPTYLTLQFLKQHVMSRLKELKYFTLIMLLCGFIGATALSSCRDQKKEEKTEEAAEHPEGEHPEGEEHPAEDSTDQEHPEGEHPEGEEHPAKDSVSG